MNLPKYPLSSSASLMTFEFVSIGKKGRIHKVIQYQATNLEGVYNLAFGDKDIQTGDINDSIISNNGDSEKVLSTVIASLYAFTDHFPDVYVYATGSTATRTRLYRIGIAKHINEVVEDFEIFGEKKNGWEDFKIDQNYEGFLVKRKINKI
jgi:hypothetical protein